MTLRTLIWLKILSRSRKRSKKVLEDSAAGTPETEPADQEQDHEQEVTS